MIKKYIFPGIERTISTGSRPCLGFHSSVSYVFESFCGIKDEISLASRRRVGRQIPFSFMLANDEMADANSLAVPGVDVDDLYLENFNLNSVTRKRTRAVIGVVNNGRRLEKRGRLEVGEGGG